MGAVLTHSFVRDVGKAYRPTAATGETVSSPADDHPDRSSANETTPLERNVMVPWFTNDPTNPENAPALSPVGALASTVNVRESAEATVPVTDAADVEPLMPVAATLTSPDDADSVGELKSGAEEEPPTYESTEALYEIDTCQDVSWFVPVKKSTGTTIVSPT